MSDQIGQRAARDAETTITIGTPITKVRKQIAQACADAGYGRGYRKEVRSTPGDPWSGHLLFLGDFARCIRGDHHTEKPGRFAPGEYTIYIYRCDSLMYQEWSLINYVTVRIEREVSDE